VAPMIKAGTFFFANLWVLSACFCIWSWGGTESPNPVPSLAVFLGVVTSSCPGLKGLDKVVNLWWAVSRGTVRTSPAYCVHVCHVRCGVCRHSPKIWMCASMLYLFSPSALYVLFSVLQVLMCFLHCCGHCQLVLQSAFGPTCITLVAQHFA
jgi:hypothetical protein